MVFYNSFVYCKKCFPDVTVTYTSCKGEFSAVDFIVTCMATAIKFSFFFTFSHIYAPLMTAFYYAISLLVLRITAYFLSILMYTVLC